MIENIYFEVDLHFVANFRAYMIDLNTDFIDRFRLHYCANYIDSDEKWADIRGEVNAQLH